MNNLFETRISYSNLGRSLIHDKLINSVVMQELLLDSRFDDLVIIRVSSL